MSSSPKTRAREHDDHVPEEPTAKRTRLDGIEDADGDVPMNGDREVAVIDISELEEQDAIDNATNQERESMLPPSHALLNAPPPVYGPDGSMQQIMETDVGISEYIGHDVPPIEGIIKQRCARPTFLMNIHAYMCPVGSQTFWSMKWIWMVKSST